VERSEAARRPIKYINPDRKQLRWEVLDLEQLITEDHAARLIWEVSGSLDLSRFEQEQKSRGRGCGAAVLA
jgi:hypothetical protein